MHKLLANSNTQINYAYIGNYPGKSTPYVFATGYFKSYDNIVPTYTLTTAMIFKMTTQPGLYFTETCSFFNVTFTQAAVGAAMNMFTAVAPITPSSVIFSLDLIKTKVNSGSG
jgi:hypothetical protein